jgi:hypothetical protein
MDLKKAALAADRKIRNIDYIVEKGKVIIIDSHTGLKKPTSNSLRSTPFPLVFQVSSTPIPVLSSSHQTFHGRTMI